MISILPEHAPPGRESSKYSLLVAGDKVGVFHEESGEDTLEQFAESMLNDIKNLESLELLPGKLTLDTLDAALDHMEVVDCYEKYSQYWTDMFRDTVKLKFLLKNDTF